MKALWTSNSGPHSCVVQMEVEVLQTKPDGSKIEIQYQTASGIVKQRWVDAARIQM